MQKLMSLAQGIKLVSVKQTTDKKNNYTVYEYQRISNLQENSLFQILAISVALLFSCLQMVDNFVKYLEENPQYTSKRCILELSLIYLPNISDSGNLPITAEYSKTINKLSVEYFMNKTITLVIKSNNLYIEFARIFKTLRKLFSAEIKETEGKKFIIQSITISIKES